MPFSFPFPLAFAWILLYYPLAVLLILFPLPFLYSKLDNAQFRPSLMACYTLPLRLIHHPPPYTGPFVLQRPLRRESI